MVLDERVFPGHVAVDVVRKTFGELLLELAVLSSDSGVRSQIVAKGDVALRLTALDVEYMQLMRSDARRVVSPEVPPPRWGMMKRNSG